MNDADVTKILMVVVSVGMVLFILVVAAMFLTLFKPWLQSFLAGAPIRIMQLLGMRLRGTPPMMIVHALIILVHRGHPHDPNRCRLAESIYLAQRVRIDTPLQLADLMEAQMKSGTAG